MPIAYNTGTNHMIDKVGRRWRSDRSLTNIEKSAAGQSIVHWYGRCIEKYPWKEWMTRLELIPNADGDFEMGDYVGMVSCISTKKYDSTDLPRDNSLRYFPVTKNKNRVNSKSTVSFNISVDDSTDIFSTTDTDGAAAEHGFGTGDIVRVQAGNASGSVIPAGLSLATDYYVIEGATTSTLKLAASSDDADAGTAIDITDTGSGTIFIGAKTNVLYWYVRRKPPINFPTPSSTTADTVMTDYNGYRRDDQSQDEIDDFAVDYVMLHAVADLQAGPDKQPLLARETRAEAEFALMEVRKNLETYDRSAATRPKFKMRRRRM